MRKWVLLGAAIVVEVAATLSLRASQDHSAWLIAVVAGYAGAFLLLTLVLRAGLSIGVAYGIWGALGTAGTAVLAAVLYVGVAVLWLGDQRAASLAAAAAAVLFSTWLAFVMIVRIRNLCSTCVAVAAVNLLLAWSVI